MGRKSSGLRPWVPPLVLAAILAGLSTGVYLIGSQHQTATDPLSSASDIIGQTAPEFTLIDTEGQNRNLKEWKGKVIAINFWATWCEPCREEIPGFNALQLSYSGRGVQFVGIAIDDLDDVKAYLKDMPLAYPILVGQDEAAEAAIKYGNTTVIIPYTAILDRLGRIAYVHYGILKPESALAVIEALL